MDWPKVVLYLGMTSLIIGGFNLFVWILAKDDTKNPSSSKPQLQIPVTHQDKWVWKETYKKPRKQKKK